MKVLVVGGGAREHALAWKLRQESGVSAVVTAPGNPGTAQLAATQEPVRLYDYHWNDDPARSVYAPSDLAPLKNRVDVTLVGSAYAPKGQAVRSLLARLIVGEIDKSIEVHVDRLVATLKTRRGALGAAPGGPPGATA